MTEPANEPPVSDAQEQLSDVAAAREALARIDAGEKPVSLDALRIELGLDRDELTGLSVTEMDALAEDLYQHRDDIDGNEVPAEHASEIRSVVSVRFGRDELDDVAAAASAAGQPLSTYIRNAALAAAISIDLEAARRELRAATRALDELGRSLGTAA